MSAMGHSRPSHFAPVLNNVRYALIATKFYSATKCRDGPTADKVRRSKNVADPAEQSR